MRRTLSLVAGLLVSAGPLAAISNAAINAPTGDTCVANGTGTAYTIGITLGANSPEQDGFAFGAQGGTVTRVNIGGVSGGTTSTSNLPANTNLAWLLGSPSAVPGASVTVSVTTSGPISSSFTVVPYDQVHNAWFDPVRCAVSKGTPVPSNKFTIQSRFTYSARAQAWSFFVTLPGPGKVNVNQSGGAKLLITGGRVSATHAGKVKLTLRTTAAGRKALAASGSLKLKLSIEFSPTNGKPGTKVLTVTLKK
jgi:hypothetical protein